jgi:ADP-heptose:LPS heptosyltransferase
MGLGDVLMWTAIVREAATHLKLDKIKVVKCKKGSMRPKNTLTNNILFQNNPYINHKEKPGFKEKTIYFGQSGKTTTNFHYLQDNYVDKWIFADNNTHVITQYCRQLDICQNPSLKCDLYFTSDEINNIKRFILTNIGNKPFAIIEPHNKKKFMEFPFVKYQNIINTLKDKIQFIQIGVPNKPVLKNVLNLLGKLTIREACLLIKYASFVICSEGGMIHMANAVDTKAIVLVSGFTNPVMTCYPEHTNIWVGEKHGPCNLTSCKICLKEKSEFDERIVVKHVTNLLNTIAIVAPLTPDDIANVNASDTSGKPSGKPSGTNTSGTNTSGTNTQLVKTAKAKAERAKAKAKAKAKAAADIHINPFQNAISIHPLRTIPDDSLCNHKNTITSLTNDTKLNNNIEVRDCKSGKGLFAKSLIPKNHTIWFDPELAQNGIIYNITDLNLNKFYHWEKDHVWHWQIGENLVQLTPKEEVNLDGSDMMNHSCNANTGFKCIHHMIALRDIQPDEEITYDYAMSETSSGQIWSTNSKFTCQCGSADCRKTLSPNDYKNPKLWSKYGIEHFAPHIRRMIKI